MEFKTKLFGKGKEQIELALLDEPIEMGLAGVVSSSILKKQIGIAVDENPERIDYDFACLAFVKDKKDAMIMLQSDLFDGLKNGTAEALTILFHEIGHLVNGDICSKCETYDEERETLVDENKVMKLELMADAFAVKYLGKDTVLKAMEDLKKRINKKYPDKDEYYVEPVIKEVDMRILHITNLDI